MVKALSLRLKRLQVRLLAVHLGHVVHTRVCLSPSSTGRRTAISCDWEGNQWSGITVLSGLSTYGLKAQVRKMSTLVRFGTLDVYFGSSCMVENESVCMYVCVC